MTDLTTVATFSTDIAPRTENLKYIRVKGDYHAGKNTIGLDLTIKYKFEGAKRPHKEKAYIEMSKDSTELEVYIDTLDDLLFGEKCDILIAIRESFGELILSALNEHLQQEEEEEEDYDDDYLAYDSDYSD